MENYLNNLTKEIRDLVYLVRDISSINNLSAYLVGGFVRDLLLGVKNLDLDFVVEQDAIKLAQDFAQRLNARLIRHKRFRTATVILRSNFKVDFATARRESYPHPAALPLVTSGSLRDDLFRRDITINAMAISINSKNFGQLIDFFGGKDDLKDKKIRILHNLSFIDDPTRILRVIRFAQRYNFRIEPKTLACLKEAVKMRMLDRIQPQRVRNELILLLKEEEPLKQIRRLQGLVGLRFISPHLSLSRNSYKLLNTLQIQTSWFKKHYPQRRQLDAWLIYFMGITHSLKARDIKLVCKKFAFPKGDERRILSFHSSCRKVISGLGKNKVSPVEIFNLLEPLTYEVTLLIKAKAKNSNVKRHMENYLEIYNGMHIFISGDDLHELGIKPGPYYEKIFKRVLKARLEGLVRTKEDELMLINRLIKKQ
jgi:tRNA nucleotidyltransferase (CCA-adding enzyme)